MRRLGTLVVILFGSSFLLFNLTAISGDPTEALRFSTDPKAAYQLHSLIRQLQLDVPPPLRYFRLMVTPLLPALFRPFPPLFAW